MNICIITFYREIALVQKWLNCGNFHTGYCIHFLAQVCTEKFNNLFVAYQNSFMCSWSVNVTAKRPHLQSASCLPFVCLSVCLSV